MLTVFHIVMLLSDTAIKDRGLGYQFPLLVVGEIPAIALYILGCGNGIRPSWYDGVPSSNLGPRPIVGIGRRRFFLFLKGGSAMKRRLCVFSVVFALLCSLALPSFAVSDEVQPLTCGVSVDTSLMALSSGGITPFSTSTPTYWTSTEISSALNSLSSINTRLYAGGNSAAEYLRDIKSVLSGTTYSIYYYIQKMATALGATNTYTLYDRVNSIYTALTGTGSGTINGTLSSINSNLAYDGVSAARQLYNIYTRLGSGISIDSSSLKSALGYSSSGSLASDFSTNNTRLSAINTSLSTVNSSVQSGLATVNSSVQTGLTTVNSSVQDVNTSVGVVDSHLGYVSDHTLAADFDKILNGPYDFFQYGFRWDLRDTGTLSDYLFALNRSIVEGNVEPTSVDILSSGGSIVKAVPNATLLRITREGFQGLASNLRGQAGSTVIYNLLNSQQELKKTVKRSNNILGAFAVFDFMQNDLARLGYMFASPDDIQLKKDHQETSDEFANSFNPSSGAGVSASDVGDMAGVSGSLSGNLDTGVSVGQAFDQMNDSSRFAFFSQECQDALNPFHSARALSRSGDEDFVHFYDPDNSEFWALIGGDE